MSAIDAHIATFPPPVQERLTLVRQTIRAESPDAAEVISYGIPTFDLDGKHLVHFAGYAHHIGLYPGAQAMVVFADALAGFKTAKGSVQFPHDQPLPLTLVAEITRWRVAQVVAKRGAKRRTRATS